MACINFVNLATAQSISRSKEVGLRKVLGGNRGQLMGQFLGEAAIIVAFSLILGTIFAKLLQPVLDSYLTINGTLELFTWKTLAFLLGLGVVVVILSGFYPAMVLSGFQPVAALKSKVSNASLGKVSLRRGLVVLQFALSQLLIIGTLVAISQMNFIRDADLGLNKDAVLILSHNADSASIARLPSLKNDILGIAGVKSVSFTSDPPTSENNWTTNFAFDGRQDEKFPLAIKVADEDYFKTFGMEFIAGGPYRKSDTMTSFVINETLVRKLGLANAQEAIGRDMRTGGGKWMPITGVVRDFKTNSLRESVKPLAMFSRSRFFYVTGVKLSGKDFTQTVKQVQAVWDKHLPEYVNSSTFLDEDIADFYRQEDQLSKLYKMFSILAIIISCLGLYGLVSFMVLQKTKEVGVRKVLGASTSSIVFLFSKEFIMLIVVAFLIAAPMAWFGMNKWLENFVFRIKLGPGIFIAAVALTLLVAWITVGYKAIRAALMNPVKSLRTE
jgi:ABC-type antimicrobial peptide transport system permease subunit